MKWIFILLLLIFAVGYVLFRFRKQIQTIYMMWYALRQMRSTMKPTAQNPEKRAVKPKANAEMVRCPTCSKWILKDDSVKLKSNYFCSLRCMEDSMSRVR
ncbi:MAG: hypothetical protein ACK5NT_00695 [Pyrinomonadaceae bacterium]